MKKFEFSSRNNEVSEVFSGRIFYNVYKDAEFLRHSENVETILAKGYELRNMLKQVKPGEIVALNGMMLERNTPLLVKKTGPNIVVENYEFTANRLSGLVAAYAFEYRHRFPNLTSTEAQLLGLTWDNGNMQKCRLYLSAVSGTEHFYDQFQFWPLVCALRKLHKNKITKEPIIKMAKIKNPSGIRMVQDMMDNFSEVQKQWMAFPSGSVQDLVKILELSPPELKVLFSKKS
ncbi:hypothetical protein KGM_209558 [Danaus plexippus plexippus]|uniref:Uncharacterized protein n=1 Tax=Danaus plexippus plexippus TaxID=278856 RepID=A0A212EPX5_DANPL|nr:hypothetical protein KGM_209558 [Danaus plexippus plexippus]